MSEDFIPLNQSTPTGNKWPNQGRIHNRGIHVHYNNDFTQQNQSHNQSGPRQRRQNHNRRRNYSQRSSYGSDSTNNSYNLDGPPIDAYIHPGMLQDPWEQIRRKLNQDQLNN